MSTNQQITWIKVFGAIIVAIISGVITILNPTISNNSSIKVEEGGVHMGPGSILSTGTGNTSITHIHNKYKTDNNREIERKLDSNQRFVDNKDGTITDFKNNIMWKKCILGRSNSECQDGSADDLTWDEAMSIAKDSNFLGYNDWIIPPKKILKSIVFCDNDNNLNLPDFISCSKKKENKIRVNSKYFKNYISSSYWTSTKEGASGAWIVSFFNGASQLARKSSKNYVVLIRYLSRET